MQLSTERPGLFAVVTVTLWSVGFALLILLAVNRFNLVADNAYNWMTDRNVNHNKQWGNVMTLWDGRWYINLAKNGYRFDPSGLSNVAFLPLYPALLRGLTYLTRSYPLSGLIINFFSLIGAVYFLIKLTQQEKFSETQTKDTVLFLLIYPTAIFFAAVYTESLFVFLAVATFYFCKRGKFFFAALFGLCAAMTRIPGLFLIVPFLYYLFKQRRPALHYFLASLIPVGTGIYLLLQKVYTGNALAFLTAQRNWGRNFGHFNPDHVYWITSAGVANTIMDILFAVGLLAGILYIYKKLDFGYALFCALVILVPLSTGSLLSIGRFGMILFPLAMSLAKSDSAWLKKGYIIVSLVLLTFYSIQFVNGYWAG